MFNSLFTKYVSAFMVIILVSFSILGIIICSMVSNYSVSIKKETVTNAETKISSYVSSAYKNSATTDFNNFIYFSFDDLKNVLTTIASSIDSDLFVIISDESGKILVTGNTEDYSLNADLPDELTQKAESGEKNSFYTDGDNFFSANHLVAASAVRQENGSTAGYVFVCSKSAKFQSLVEKTSKTIVVASLWVMLAALVSVYFISDKIISPIKIMSRAAKEFSQGKFDTKVPEEGNGEVAELAAAFNNMASNIAKTEDMRRTFLANVSHDLRTPMTTISGFVDGILSGAIPPENERHYLEIVSSEVKRLSRLVSSLLDISRFQAGERKIVKANFDICEMARQIIISLEQKLDAKKLDVSFEADRDNMFADADRDAIYQVLYNLCDNATKFAREEGKYCVKIIENDKKIFVSVFNEGIGIKPDELPYVFDRFYKSDKSRGLDKTGVGLGLYIVKTIIDAHGEEIWVKSKYGDNCEFVFTLTPGKTKRPKNKSAEGRGA